jgi:hypothetical protein
MAFLLNCYRDLKHELGVHDSVVELNELAIRYLDQQAQKSGNVSDFISRQSDIHGINVNFSDMPEDLRSFMAKSYVVGVYRMAEVFFNEFKRESNRIFDIDWKYSKEESKIFTAYKNIAPKINYEDNFLLNIFEYYRYVRNCWLHGEKAKVNINIEHEKLNRFTQEIAMYKEQHKFMNAPNSFDNVDFEDFIMFSKVTKDVAYSLCGHCVKLINKSNFNNIINMKKYRSIKNKPRGLTTAIENELRTVYSLSNGEIKELLQKIDITKYL